MQIFIYINIIFIIMLLVSKIALNFVTRSPKYFSPTRINSSLRILLILFFIAPFIQSLFLKQQILIISSNSKHNASIEKTNQLNNHKFVSTNDHLNPSKHEQIFTYCLIILFIILNIKQLIKYLENKKKLNLILERTYLFKRYKKVSIYLSDEVSMPFAYWRPFNAIVVLPTYLLTNKKSFNLVLSHELQHHRHGDTKWIYVLIFLKLFISWNPFFILFEIINNEIQELACDEVLIGRKSSSLIDYRSSLLEVAKQSLYAQAPLEGTTGMALSKSGKKLKRRINTMERYQKIESKIGKILSLFIVFLLVGGVAYASKDFFSGKKLTKIEAEKLVKNNLIEKHFPIEMNEEILEQLNKYIGTENGRKFIKKSLVRKKAYEEIFNKKLRKYNAPNELLAVALMESGFNNLPQKDNRMKSAGIWQFIPSTARNYGLIVTDETDERLNVFKETDAAIRLLTSLKLRFKDWKLAVMAYNAGDRKIQQGINDTGSRNAWNLVREGYSGDKGYLSKVLAGVIILKNPSLLK